MIFTTILKGNNFFPVMIISEVFLVFSILFAVEDLLNIVGDSVVTQSGQRRIVINMIDILLIVLSIVYYFIPCPTDRFCRIMGSILVLFKFIRSYKVLVFILM